MTLNTDLQQAYDQLLTLKDNGTLTIDNVRTLFGSLSAEVEGAQAYVFYSGRLGSESSWAIAQALGDASPLIAIIDKTVAGQFLGNSLITDFLQQNLFGGSKELLSARLFSDPDSLWAQLSSNYAESASGRIITITANAADDGIWATIELPKLLSDPEAFYLGLNL